MFTVQRNSASRLAVLIAAICFGSVAAVGQLATGSIQGLVSDKSGAVVPNAAVTVANPATGFSRKGVTNGAGLYDFPDLPPGDYELNATLRGFDSAHRRINFRTGRDGVGVSRDGCRRSRIDGCYRIKGRRG